MSVSATVKTIRRKDSRGRKHCVGYEVIIPNITDFDRQRKSYGKRFHAAEKSLAESYRKQEWEEMLRCCEKHEQYLPKTERDKRNKLKGISFAQFAQQWVDGYRNSRTGQPLRADSRRNKRTYVRHLIDFFRQEKHDMALAAITQKDCRDCSDWLAQLGVYAQVHSMRTLKAILKEATKDIDGVRPALIKSNPCDDVPIPHLPKKSAQSQIPEATPQQLETIASAMPEQHRIAVWLGALLGLRISEACALQVRDFDFTATDRLGNPAPRVYIRHALTRDANDHGPYMLAGTKNDASHAPVDLSPQFAQMCREHIERFTDGKPDSMFLPAKISHILSPDSLRSEFDVARRAAGRPDLHFHTLRKTHDNEYVGHTRSEAEALQGTRRDDASVLREHYEEARSHDVRRAQYETQEALLPKIRTADSIRLEIKTLQTRQEKIIQKIEADRKELAAMGAADGKE
jgi:integrase